jgi:hypothetical protein
VEALGELPVIAKLDLSGNSISDEVSYIIKFISIFGYYLAHFSLYPPYLILYLCIIYQSAICLIRLLILQAKQVREIIPNGRMDAIYISEVMIEKNKAFINDRILEDIGTVNTLLQYSLSAKNRKSFKRFLQ